MGSSFFHILVTVIVAIFSSSAEVEKIAEGFKKADSEAVSTYFASSIQLTTPGKDGVYSKAQSKIILKQFFDTHTPQNASVVSEGKNDNGAHFAVINLETAKGNFKVDLFLRKSNNSLKIQELKITKN